MVTKAADNRTKRSATLDRMARVLEYDQGGMDDGQYFVVLAHGWAFYDAAATLADDPDGAHAAHCRGDTVRALVTAIRDAQPCQCGRCTEGR